MALVYEKQTLIAMQKVHRKKQKDKTNQGKKSVKNDQSFWGKAPCLQKENEKKAK